jgi:penicillin-binding protein 2
MEKASSRLRLLAVVMVLMFVALTTRLWFLQVLASDRFRSEARNNSVRTATSEALRGTILDAEGKRLVVNKLSLEVRVNRQELGADADAVVYRLADVLGVPVSDIRESLANPNFYPFQPIPVAEFVHKKVKFYIDEHQDEFPGVEVVETPVRGYPRGRMAAHVLGNVGQISGTQLDELQDQGYGQSDQIGRAGLELVYERYLRGQKGQQRFVVNSDGETIRALPPTPPTPGDNLVLTLQARVQRIAERELRTGMAFARTLNDSTGKPYKANAGTVVVLDAKTGGVVALASLPGFDPRWYPRGLTEDENNYLHNERRAPQLNRAVQQRYIPGSTFKPFVALAAMKEGLADQNEYYPCTGSYLPPSDPNGRPFTNWDPTGSGTITIETALRISCDTVFYPWGYEFWDMWRQQQLGENNEPFQKDLREWGFGSPTGIDLVGEDPGVVPDAAFAQEHPDIYPEGWQPFGDILLSIGSGNLEVTPLQLASAYQALANGGLRCVPHLVDRIQDSEGHLVKDVPDQCDQQLPYAPDQITYIRDALETVTSGGTASCAFSGFPLDRYPVAGKTGTAVRGGTFQDTSWFAGVALPPDDRQYVVVASVEQGGFGGQVAAPIVRRIIEGIYGVTDAVSPSCIEGPDR